MPRKSQVESPLRAKSPSASRRKKAVSVDKKFIPYTSTEDEEDEDYYNDGGDGDEVYSSVHEKSQLHGQMLKRRVLNNNHLDEEDHVANDGKDGQVVVQSILRSGSKQNLPAHNNSNNTNNNRSGVSSKNAEMYGPLLTEMPQQTRWQNWWTRTVWTVIMLSTFAVIICSGPMAIILLIVGVSTLVFKEVISIAWVPSKEKKLPWFRLINWYFLMVTNYYLYGETAFNFFNDYVIQDAFLQSLATHHRFYSYLFYCVGIMFFVTNLKKGHYKFQFLQFFWTHMTLLLVTIPPNFIILTILHANIGWFLLPVMLVITNDVMAYIGGFFFGRTRLIKVSPKKTWEGFLFGFVFTLAASLLYARVITVYPYLYCPVRNLFMNAWTQNDCVKNAVYIPVSYKLSPVLQSLCQHIFRQDWKFISIAPLQFHAVILGTFASLIAVFGGFFASGFKRAFKLKDFGDSIPGHGGVTDRMDCQFIMGIFTFMYYTSFIKEYDTVTVASILSMAVHGLNRTDLIELYHDLGEYVKRIDKHK
ncbi:hypothetical protein MP228_001870 [Amoeboaphelidium protococcarum]|nr:hypothetical protein MP228_001870 [Amoeboaphelidium protococcarum]